MIKKILLSSLILCSIVPSVAHAIVCGRVPVYCVMEIDRTKDHKTTLYETMPLLAACVQTEYKFGNAAPICKVKELNKQELYKKCLQLYPNEPYERVVGITYYKGGDPVSPLSKKNTSLWGNSYYQVTDLVIDSINPKVKGRPVPGCDVISDAI